MTNEIEQKIEAIATELRQAKRVLFITGAGISADGGDEGSLPLLVGFGFCGGGGGGFGKSNPPCDSPCTIDRFGR